MNMFRESTRFIGFALVILLFVLPLTAGAVEKGVFKKNKDFEAQFAVSTGLRTDSLSWTIASDLAGVTTPNILSELAFNDLRSYIISIKGEATIARRFYVRGEVSTGNIFDGDTRDSDWAGDDRTLEFSRSMSENDGDSVLDFSVGAGYRFNFNQNRLAMIPLVGYSYHEQNIAISDGVQVIPNTGPFPGLNSTYEAEWSGPWVGVDFLYEHKSKTTSDWTLVPNFGLELHWADYRGVGNWNLRRDFANPTSFIQEADGFGLVLRAGLDIQWQKYWTFSLGYLMQNWETDAGLDTVVFADRNTASILYHGAEWTSHAIKAGVGIRF